MPNHFHLVLWPEGDDDLSRGMHWLMTAHVRRYHQHYHSSGHVRQGRFKAFAIEQDDHLLTVLRYVERNPLRAGLVRRAEDWPWSSLHGLAGGSAAPFLIPGPVPRPEGWVAWVNAPMTGGEGDELHQCAERCRPFGSAAWVRQTADRLGLGATLRPRGRPPRRPSPAE